MNKMRRPRPWGQQGFSAGVIILVILLVGSVYLAFRFVQRANEDNKKQADTLQGALTGEDQPGITDDTDAGIGYEQPESPSEYQDRPIKTVNVELQALHVVIKSTLPVRITGTCRVEVEQSDGSGYRRFIQDLERSDDCEITIPRNKLEGSKTWLFQVSYVSSNGQSRGTHEQTTLQL